MSSETIILAGAAAALGLAFFLFACRAPGKTERPGCHRAEPFCRQELRPA